MMRIALGITLSLFMVAPQAARAEMPDEIQAFTQENIASCEDVGGTPNLAGVQAPGAGQATDGRPPYLTEAGDLNGDGRPDFVTDLTGLECAGAWSLFCGSAGCPVTVWLSGPEGYAVAWGGHAQQWELRGSEVVVSLHGQLCSPPRIGAESCEVAMRFDQTPQRGPSAATGSPPASAAGAWQVRRSEGGLAVAEGPGTGALDGLTALCLRDRPVMMAALEEGAGDSSLTFAFIFSDRVIEVTGQAGQTTRRTYILDPRTQGLAAALSGNASDVRLQIAGVDQGILSLSGSTNALREVLSPCLDF